MRTSVDALLRQHGTDLTLSSGESTRTLRGFLQAISSTSWQSMVCQASPLGQVPQGQYLYIGPADGAVLEGDILSLEGRSYQLCRVETYEYSGRPIYQWGLCVERSGDRTWGTTD